MYQQAGFGKGGSEAKRPGYTTHEWDAIATEMIRRWPNRVFNRYDFSGFLLEDFEDAMEAVMPQEKQKSFDDFSQIRGLLFEAFQRVYKRDGKPVQVKAEPLPVHDDGRKAYVRMSPQEWERVILEYNKCFPGEFSDRLKNTNLRKIHHAIECLPVDRRRKFYAATIFAETALKIWDGLPEAEKNKHLQDRQIAEFPNAVIPQPVKLASHDQSAIASAIHGAFEAKPEPKKAGGHEPNRTMHGLGITLAGKERKRKAAEKRITWTDEEWIAVGREMIRQNPYENYLNSQLSGMEMEAARAAQRVVIEPARRRRLTDRARVVPKLLEAFAAIKAQQAEGIAPVPAAKVEPVEAAEAVSDAVLQTENVAEPAHEELQQVKESLGAEKPSITETIAVQAVSTMAESVTMALAQAAQPLVSSVLGAFAKALVPEITKSLLPELTKTISAEIALAVGKIQIPHTRVIQVPVTVEAAVIPAAPVAFVEPVAAPAALPKPPVPVAESAPTESVALTQREHKAAFLGQQEAKPAKPMIAMVGPMGKQKTELERAYPELDMVFIENGHGIKRAAEKCALFLASTRHMPANIAQSVKMLVPKDKLVYVDGATSGMRREINGWKLENRIR